MLIRVLVGVLIAIVLFAVGALAVIYTGVYNVSATEPHFAVVRWALDTTFKNSVRRRSQGVSAPDLGAANRIRTGARAFAGQCSQCHGAPGQQLPRMAQNMRPAPPPLSNAATEWSPEELFWIITNGVRMTGMPAWGWLSEERRWELVAFVNAMPTMTADDYKELTARQPQEQQSDADGAEQASEAQSQQTAQTQNSQDETAPAVTVGMTNTFNFDPARITVKVGDTVRWENTSRMSHTVTAVKDKARDPSHVALPSGAEEFDSGMIAPGESYSRKFTVPGEYKYFCIPHEAAGMIGEIVVKG